MKVKVSDLQNGVMGIYKINYPNGKIYIGLSIDIKRRMVQHNSPHNGIIKKPQPCDLAIKKYGRIEEIEILEFVQDANILAERQKYWIKYFNSNNREIGYNITAGGEDMAGENNPRAVFSNKDILDIRKRRFQGERKRDVYQEYRDRSFGTFENIWLGRTVPHIGKQFIIPAHQISKQEYSSIANRGQNNNKAKLTENDVLSIRKRYDSGESINDIYKDYQFVNKVTIKRVCKRETWTHLN